MAIFKTGDMWDRFGKVDLFCITVNGTFKADGSLVIGAGIAKQARDQIPSLEKIAGQHLRACYELAPYDFPLFYFIGNSKINGQSIGLFQVKHHFNEPASFELIKRSTVQLFKYISNYPKITVCLNFPGIGHHGKLKRNEVLPIIELLPDNVEVWEHGSH